MPRTKPRFTLEEHDKIGRELQIFDNRLAEIMVRIGNAYPYKEKVHSKADRAREALRELRYDLENLACQEHKDNGRINVLKIYDRNGTEEFAERVDFDSTRLELVKSTVD